MENKPENKPEDKKYECFEDEPMIFDAAMQALFHPAIFEGLDRLMTKKILASDIKSAYEKYISRHKERYAGLTPWDIQEIIKDTQEIAGDFYKNEMIEQNAVKHKILNQLMKYAGSGELGAGREAITENFKQHLFDCPDCSRRYRAYVIHEARKSLKNSLDNILVHGDFSIFNKHVIEKDFLRLYFKLDKKHNCISEDDE